ncbi:MAG: hypothetical protein ABIA63_05635 [bacterium]
MELEKLLNSGNRDEHLKALNFLFKKPDYKIISRAVTIIRQYNPHFIKEEPAKLKSPPPK